MTLPSPVSDALFARALARIPGGVNSPVRAFRAVGGTPFFTVRASGSHLHTADGQELIDFVGTWGPAIHGHNPPAIRMAIAKALESGTSFGTPNPAEVELAEWITELVPSVEKVRCCNSGTEATMSCIRLARGFTGRDKIIKFAGCYHGHVDSLLVQAGSGPLTLGCPDSAGIPASFAAETLVLPYNDVPALEAAFKQKGEEIAGVIVEPYPANCGLILPDAGFLAKLRELCSRFGAVLIFDEVMTGFRLALGGVQELEGIIPDLTAMGKIIGGGLPVGAFGGRSDIMSFLSPEGPVYQAGTLSGNPLAMAAGIAALRLLRESDPFKRLHHQTGRLAEVLRSTAAEKGLPMQVPQTGSMFSIFFADAPVRNYSDALTSRKDFFKPLFHAALEGGVYLPPSPFETAFVSTAHDDATMEKACGILSSALKRI